MSDQLLGDSGMRIYRRLEDETLHASMQEFIEASEGLFLDTRVDTNTGMSIVTTRVFQQIISQAKELRKESGMEPLSHSVNGVVNNLSSELDDSAGDPIHARMNRINLFGPARHRLRTGGPVYFFGLQLPDFDPAKEILLNERREAIRAVAEHACGRGLCARVICDRPDVKPHITLGIVHPDNVYKVKKQAREWLKSKATPREASLGAVSVTVNGQRNSQRMVS